MPFLGTVTMEYCDTTTNDVARDAVLEAARRTPRDVDDWFLTLTRANEDYMDATMNADGTFRVQFSEGLGKAERVLIADSPVDEALLVKLLESYYENDGAWKTLCAWKAPAKKIAVPEDLRLAGRHAAPGKGRAGAEQVREGIRD